MSTRTASWDKPGPGTWEHDQSHCGPAPGPIQRAIYEHCLPTGMGEGMAEFGSPIKTMQMAWVNGKFYRRLVPQVGGGRDLPPPPKPLLWLASRLHPTLRAQERRAKESFEAKRWRAELARWEREWKPALIADNLAAGEIDLPGIDDPGLADHLEQVYARLLESGALHFRLHVSDMGPLGDLMVHLEDWGLDRESAFHALVAASPATREPARQLAAVGEALREAGVDPATVRSIDDVEAVPEAKGLLDEYLQHHGWRLTTGYDLEDRSLIELPDVIAASVRATAKRQDVDDDGAEASIAALREQIPPADRETFDEIVEDARLSYGLRDENGPLTYEWPAGLLRRALLEAGRRLTSSGALASESEVFELSTGEVAALLRGGPGPGRDEIERRAAERRWWATLDAPDRLGPEETPPPISALPPNLGRMTRIVLTVVDTLESASTEALHGMGIGDEVYVGTARVVHDAVEALAAMEPGDIVVAPYTAPTYNSVLAMAGAIVTEEGGPLCHAAVIARELGLPAVIGAKGAMGLIDGATIEVDPKAGLVRVV
ncbi:MAG: PEP-utilizing enzyme [Acidimicrobiales bacterium]